MNKSNIKRVRITSDGKLTKVFAIQTGEEIPFVQSLKFEHRIHGRPLVFVEQLYQVDSFDIVADAPYGAMSSVDHGVEIARMSSTLAETGTDPALIAKMEEPEVKKELLQSVADAIKSSSLLTAADCLYIMQLCQKLSLANVEAEVEMHRAQVQESIDDPRPSIPHDSVMAEKNLGPSANLSPDNFGIS